MKDEEQELSTQLWHFKFMVTNQTEIQELHCDSKMTKSNFKV